MPFSFRPKLTVVGKFEPVKRGLPAQIMGSDEVGFEGSGPVDKLSESKTAYLSILTYLTD